MGRGKGFEKTAEIVAKIADGSNTKNVQNASDVQSTSDVPNVKNGKDVNKEGVELARLNLKIPLEIKEYLTIAAAKESIAQRRNISLTQYLCELVTADMEKNKDQ